MATKLPGIAVQQEHEAWLQNSAMQPHTSFEDEVEPTTSVATADCTTLWEMGVRVPTTEPDAYSLTLADMKVDQEGSPDQDDAGVCCCCFGKPAKDTSNH